MRTIFLFLVMLMMNGCATYSSVQLQPNVSYRPITPEDVTVYHSMADVKGTVQIIAELRFAGMTMTTEESIEGLKKEAARLGANGIVIDAGELTFGFESKARAILVENKPSVPFEPVAGAVH
jgi:hypothetical protein